MRLKTIWYAKGFFERFNLNLRKNVHKNFNAIVFEEKSESSSCTTKQNKKNDWKKGILCHMFISLIKSFWNKFTYYCHFIPVKNDIRSRIALCTILQSFTFFNINWFNYLKRLTNFQLRSSMFCVSLVAELASLFFLFCYSLRFFHLFLPFFICTFVRACYPQYGKK